MVLTPSFMIPLGTKAPDFKLPDTVSGKVLTLNEMKSDIATVIMFICNHCPFVQHIQHKLAEVSDRYRKKGIRFIAINSNDIESYPEDDPIHMKQIAEEKAYSFPYLFDESQEVARAYHAQCTPDFFIFDKDLKCVYRGRFDDSTPGRKVPITGKDLTNALDAILSGKAVEPDQKPSQGCNIKWKS